MKMKGVGIIYIHAGLRQWGDAEVPSSVTDREVGVVDTCWRGSIVEMQGAKE